MRKSEVQFHSERRGPHAAVNVKLWGAPGADPEAVALEEGHSAEFAQEFAAWYSKLSEHRREGFFEMAREGGWDLLTEDARTIYGQSAVVHSEGRSGGWAVVAPDGRHHFTREDVAGWDAIALAKWAKFCKCARGICDDIPRGAVWQAMANGFEAEHELREESRRFSFWHDVPTLASQPQAAQFYGR